MKVESKKVLDKIPAPLTIGSLQFFIGSLYCVILWLMRLRTYPNISNKSDKKMQELGLFHFTGQLFVMVSLGAGPVSVTHTVKALEPLFNVFVSSLILGKWMHWKVNVALFFVAFGVGVSI